jgi:hypothetical protein
VTFSAPEQIDRHGHMRHAAARHRGPAGELQDILDVRRPHDAAVVHAYVHGELIELVTRVIARQMDEAKFIEILRMFIRPIP